MTTTTKTSRTRENFFRTLYPSGLLGRFLEIAGFYASSAPKRIWVQSFQEAEEIIAGISQDQKDVYFGVGLRDKRSGKKEDVYAITALWADIDSKAHGGSMSRCLDNLQGLMVKPTIIVASGHGYHGYWVLKEPLIVGEDVDLLKRAEKAMSNLADLIGGDHVQNVNRIMRVPGTVNHKDPGSRGQRRVQCKIHKLRVDKVYGFEYLEAALAIGKKYHMLATSEEVPPRYNSRSERDQAVMNVAVQAGMDEGDVLDLFSDPDLPLCQKKDEHDKPQHYITKTYRSAVDYAEEQTRQKDSLSQADLPIRATSFGYWRDGKGSSKQLTSWTYTPEVLLQDAETAEWLWAGTLNIAGGQEIRDFIFPVHAFNTRQALLDTLPTPDLSFRGTNGDAIDIRSWIEVTHRDIPQKTAVHTLGRYGNDWLLDTDIQKNEKYVYVPRDRTGPPIKLVNMVKNPRKEVVRDVLKKLPMLNQPTTIWPILGWFFAAPFKPLIHDALGFFPILSIAGGPGAGKTSLAQLLCRLFGHSREISEQGACDSTLAALLVYLSSTNSIPVLMDEYRPSELSRPKKAEIHRLLRTTFNEGAYRRSNVRFGQRIFRLTSPVILSGETWIDEPALMERCVQVTMSPRYLTPDSPALEAYRDILNLDPGPDFASAYLDWTLGIKFSGSRSRDLAEKVATPDVQNAVSQRVLDNHGVVFWGLEQYQAFANDYGVEVSLPDFADIFYSSISMIIEMDETGVVRAPTHIDTFLTQIVNGIVLGSRDYAEVPFWLDESHDSPVLWINLRQAYDRWVRSSSRDTEILSYRTVYEHMRDLFLSGERLVKDVGQETKTPDGRPLKLTTNTFWGGVQHNALPIDLGMCRRVLGTVDGWGRPERQIPITREEIYNRDYQVHRD